MDERLKEYIERDYKLEATIRQNIQVGAKSILGVSSICTEITKKDLEEKEVVIVSGQRGDTIPRTVFEGIFDPPLIGDDDGNGILRKKDKRKFRKQKGWKDILCK